MFSIKGTYEKGTIRLLEPLTLVENSEVIITFLDSTFELPSSSNGKGNGASASEIVETESKSEEYYEKFRKHKRFRAKGNIVFDDNGNELTFPLYDYSAGGLSFISDRVFEINRRVTATLKYSAAGEILVMEFDIEIKRVVLHTEGGMDNYYKVGCMFLDQVDEELWHMIMG